LGQQPVYLTLRTVKAGLLVTALIATSALVFSLSLRFYMTRLIFREAMTVPTGWDEEILVSAPSEAATKLYRYGDDVNGCVVFFPGQHGFLPRYKEEIFAQFQQRRVSVFALVYPAEASRQPLSQTMEAVVEAVDVALKNCRSRKVLLVGRSLGSMVAAYTSVKVQTQVSGLLLEGVSPSLSTAIHAKLSMHWMLKPLNWMPVHSILQHDYSLTEALNKLNGVPVVIFQGSEDELAPATILQEDRDLVRHAKLNVIEGGRHSDTYLLAGSAFWDCAMTMLAHGKPINTSTP